MSGRRVLYTVRRGDTIYSISRQFQVSVGQLKTWNGINERHQIKAGRRLVMYVEESLKAGLRGPTLLEDFILREKITHFDHERIPERVVHARGSAAHGFFQVYESQADLTMAAPFEDPGEKTPVFVRFSTVAGSRGSTPAKRLAS